jgi:hypothetical protein
MRLLAEGVVRVVRYRLRFFKGGAVPESRNFVDPAGRSMWLSPRNRK